ncbi:hypothetical protein BGW80DRAFT_1178295 [Lactifluus volemus]|nr:hypothetical protein BGW80DRAFT_1178295 [Lactifluus volemus]
MSQPRRLVQTHHYIRFSISPPSADSLLIRRALQEALAQSFGVALSHTYLDVLWVADSGTECIVRASSPSDAASVMAAVAVSSGQLRLSVIKESSFLPSVSGETRKLFEKQINTHNLLTRIWGVIRITSKVVLDHM